jgi:dihydrofolate reductase
MLILEEKMKLRKVFNMTQIKSTVFIATSLDGFISRGNGDIDWLMEANKCVPKGEDFGYKAFMDTVDTLVMGRNSYEVVLKFPEWPYKGKQVVVMSRNHVDIPKHIQKLNVSCSSEHPEKLCKRLASNGAKQLYIDGGITIQRFLNAGQIKNIVITVIPILLGKGNPLFGPTEKDIHLHHINTTSYDFGFVQYKYEVKNLNLE